MQTKNKLIPYKEYISIDIPRYKVNFIYNRARKYFFNLDNNLNYYELNGLNSEDIYIMYGHSYGIDTFPLWGKIDITNEAKKMLAKCQRKCYLCHKLKFSSKTVAIRGNYYCKECTKDMYVNCVNCNHNFFESDNIVNLMPFNGRTRWGCVNCFRERTGNLPSNRPYQMDVIGEGMGIVVQSARGYGIEIECYYTNREEITKKILKLPTNFGITRDGSLDTQYDKNDKIIAGVGYKMKDGRIFNGAFEIQTPILKGNEGETYLFNLCKALNYKDNAQIDIRCGLHIHLDMSDCNNDVETIKRLIAFHWIYEPVIMSLLPQTRRANEYCKSLKNDYHYDQLLEITTMQKLHTFWYRGHEGATRFDHTNNTRYHGVNLHELFTKNNVEIRYHSGTTNPRKMLHWVNLHARIIDYCAGKISSTPDINTIIRNGLTPFKNLRTLSILTKQMFELLQLNGECHEYFKDRQNKFKDQKGLKEVEFIEKEPLEFEDETNDIENPYQLSLAQYEQLLINNQEVK